MDTNLSFQGAVVGLLGVAIGLLFTITQMLALLLLWFTMPELFTWAREHWVLTCIGYSLYSTFSVALFARRSEACCKDLWWVFA